MFGKNSSHADPRIKFFDRQAANWDSEEPVSHTAIAQLGAFQDLLGFSSGQDLLEVGCGTGKLTRWLADQVAPGGVTAVDFSQDMLNKARAKNINAKLRHLDVCGGDLGEGLYDVVFCFHCFPHFRDQPAAMRNLARCLKPPGRLIVIHLAGSDHINAFHAGIDGPVAGDHLPQGGEWNPLLAQAGLRRDRLIDREDLFFLQASRGDP